MRSTVIILEIHFAIAVKRSMQNTRLKQVKALFIVGYMNIRIFVQLLV